MPAKILLPLSALLLVLNANAEERPAPALTSLSSTTISGYVNVSAVWNAASPPVRFEDLCRAVRERGFEMKRSGRHSLFFRSGGFALHLRKRGPFAHRSDVLRVRHFLKDAP